jgi:ubiquinone/menaquinone biosynthesis C-methylase UbiE
MRTETAAAEAYQSSFQTAFKRDLDRILNSLPVPANARVLDVPCGNGFYARRLADRLGADGRLVAVDVSDDCLERTRSRLNGVSAPAVEVVEADAYALPFPDDTFDVVWCAQSLISLDPVRAVREMHRVVKPAGLVAILEVDEFHHVLLPWPAAVEAELPAAVHAACVRKYGDGVKLSPTRRLRRVLKQAGFGSVRRDTYPAERAAPFDRSTTEFINHHLDYLRSLAYPHLPASLRPAFDRMSDPDSPDSLFRMPDAEVVLINVVYFARGK